jgi:hypothetical protein
VVEGVGDADARGEGDKYCVAPVMGASGVDAVSPLSVLRPRRPLFSGVVDDNELAWGVNGAGGKIEGGTVEAVPGRDRGI